MDSNRQRGQGKGQHYVFGWDQIQSADVSAFCERYDPSRLTAWELRPLFGSVSLELDWAGKPADSFLIPEARRWVRSLHQQCPWLGFFLAHDRPFGAPNAFGQFPFLGLALCLCDLYLLSNTHTGIARIEASQHQLRKFQNELIAGLYDVGQRSQLILRVLALRELEIRLQLGRMLRPAGGK